MFEKADARNQRMLEQQNKMEQRLEDGKKFGPPWDSGLHRMVLIAAFAVIGASVGYLRWID